MEKFKKSILVYTLVVTYNGSKWVEKCFGSLVFQSIPEHKIYAIDNGSTDDTIEIIHNKFPDVEIIENGKNLGFGKANNIGLKIALKNGADYVFLLNQDAWLEKEDTIEKLINTHQKNPEYGIISPIHFNADGKLDKGFMSYIIRDKNSEYFIDLFSKNPFKTIYSCEGINAAAWLLSRECIELNGGFMPIFQHYGEDDNYCERVLHSDLKIGFVPGLKIIHDRGNRGSKIPFLFRIRYDYRKYLKIMTSLNQNFNEKVISILKLILRYRINPIEIIFLPFSILKIIKNIIPIINQTKLSKRKNHNFLD